MKNIAEILKSLGLNESEIQTYLAALKHGAGSVADLTTHTHLSRQAVYLAIEAMTERGLMSSVLHGKKRLYAAEPPVKLVAYAKRKEREMEEQIAELERTLPALELQLGGKRPAVRMFEGKEGIRAFLVDLQHSKPKEMYELADLSAVHAHMDVEELKPLQQELQRNKTKVHGVYAGKVTGNTVQANQHMLDDESEAFGSNIAVYGDTISLIAFEEKLYNVMIESPSLAKALRVLFKQALKSLKKK